MLSVIKIYILTLVSFLISYSNLYFSFFNVNKENNISTSILEVDTNIIDLVVTYYQLGCNNGFTTVYSIVSENVIIKVIIFSNNFIALTYSGSMLGNKMMHILNGNIKPEDRIANIKRYFNGIMNIPLVHNTILYYEYCYGNGTWAQENKQLFKLMQKHAGEFDLSSFKASFASLLKDPIFRQLAIKHKFYKRLKEFVKNIDINNKAVTSGTTEVKKAVTGHGGINESGHMSDISTNKMHDGSVSTNFKAATNQVDAIFSDINNISGHDIAHTFVTNTGTNNRASLFSGKYLIYDSLNNKYSTGHICDIDTKTGSISIKTLGEFSQTGLFYDYFDNVQKYVDPLEAKIKKLELEQNENLNETKRLQKENLKLNELLKRKNEEFEAYNDKLNIVSRKVEQLVRAGAKSINEKKSAKLVRGKFINKKDNIDLEIGKISDLEVIKKVSELETKIGHFIENYNKIEKIVNDNQIDMKNEFGKIYKEINKVTDIDTEIKNVINNNIILQNDLKDQKTLLNTTIDDTKNIISKIKMELKNELEGELNLHSKKVEKPVRRGMVPVTKNTDFTGIKTPLKSVPSVDEVKDLIKVNNKGIEEKINKLSNKIESGLEARNTGDNNELRKQLEDLTGKFAEAKNMDEFIFSELVRLENKTEEVRKWNEHILEANMISYKGKVVKLGPMTAKAILANQSWLMHNHLKDYEEIYKSMDMNIIENKLSMNGMLLLYKLCKLLDIPDFCDIIDCAFYKDKVSIPQLELLPQKRVRFLKNWILNQVDPFKPRGFRF